MFAPLSMAITADQLTHELKYALRVSLADLLARAD
jgi:hypothetical protein